jgi:hypothetical protein
VSSETVPDEDNGAKDGEANSQLRNHKWEGTNPRPTAERIRMDESDN